ncbi:putative ferric-chelate reductase 1 [Physella acuta]|uniref:putative ferric-chelate reductase 1 n=1 Tax=Physella acuta TaxID=109671 RepID=UPI0027DCA645|nr:putative ferric-chelate reductase 1 [Physella acuta]XP_059176715.1 putative ferric-chelate reductase 1 [Physella acuta]XP_059176716.1 putative ferric-chelate reductase 1 [Physella acuta]XP_059176717.1 putative ferric-chelate reductase 1 [Physella acuta]XP_059176718.1 putative ferric-chelate reductase 1 [Physella acuta]XP_059176719.1 putative ferric-chelate reductase 1 [Physella acuta]
MAVMLQAIGLVLVLWVGTVVCFPDGANVDNSCSDMVPQHGAPAKTSTPPYTISFTPTSYTPGQQVTVHLRGNGNTFKGFMIQAKRADGSSNELLGSFTAIAGTRQACNGQALIHTESRDKSSKTFIWSPPAEDVGYVVFRATFVQSELTFWTNVASRAFVSTASNHSTLAPSGASTEVPPAQSLGTVPADPKCDGKTKGCFTSCTGNTCKFIVSWKEDGTDVVYNFTAAVGFFDGSYVALGFSSGSSMGGDSVMGCAFGTNGTVVSFTAENLGKTSSTFADDNVKLISQSYDDDVLTCSTRRPIAGSGKRFDVSQNWTLLFARGRAFVGSQVILTNHLNEKYISIAAVTSKYSENVDAKQQNNDIYKFHGCLMVASWLIFSSIGIITARFYTPGRKNTILSLKVWFLIISSCFLAVCILTAVFSIVLKKAWSNLENEAEYVSSHPIIGAIVMILTVITLVMFMFRDYNDTPKRPLVNRAHFIVGVSAHILAVIAIFFGVRLRGAATPYYTVYILGAYVAWILFVEILLELITFCDKRIVTYEVYEMSSSDNSKLNPPGTEIEKTILIKRVILVVHCVVVVSLAVAVIAIIGVGEGSDS